MLGKHALQVNVAHRTLQSLDRLRGLGGALGQGRRFTTTGLGDESLLSSITSLRFFRRLTTTSPLEVLGRRTRARGRSSSRGLVVFRLVVRGAATCLSTSTHSAASAARFSAASAARFSSVFLLSEPGGRPGFRFATGGALSTPVLIDSSVISVYTRFYRSEGRERIISKLTWWS